MKRKLFAVACMLSATTMLVPASPAWGARGSSSSLTLILMDSTDGLPHHGQSVTFSVSTTATAQPFVRLNCYQNGAWVYTSTVGYFPSYPWDQFFTLTSGNWTSGAANCTATLESISNKTLRETNLATLTFPVYA
jgi:hypothetical protein